MNLIKYRTLHSVNNLSSVATGGHRRAHEPMHPTTAMVGLGICRNLKLFGSGGVGVGLADSATNLLSSFLFNQCSIILL